MKESKKVSVSGTPIDKNSLLTLSNSSVSSKSWSLSLWRFITEIVSPGRHNLVSTPNSAASITSDFLIYSSTEPG